MVDQVTTGGRILGVILVIVGLVLLLTRFTDLDVGGLWPLFLLVPGVALLVIGFSGSDRVAETATVVGAPITTVGLLLTYQNLTDHWESWSYAWALVVLAVGVSRWLGESVPTAQSTDRQGLALPGSVSSSLWWVCSYSRG